MFGTSKQYEVTVEFLRYKPYTKSLKTFKKFVRDIYFDPSDDVGINQIMNNLLAERKRCHTSIRVKEKEAKKLQKMHEKSEVIVHNLRQIT